MVDQEVAGLLAGCATTQHAPARQPLSELKFIVVTPVAIRPFANSKDQPAHQGMEVESVAGATCKRPCTGNPAHD